MMSKKYSCVFYTLAKFDGGYLMSFHMTGVRPPDYRGKILYSV